MYLQGHAFVHPSVRVHTRVSVPNPAPLPPYRRHPLIDRLACPHDDGHTRPALIVDEHAHGRVGRCLAARRDLQLGFRV